MNKKQLSVIILILAAILVGLYLLKESRHADAPMNTEASHDKMKDSANKNNHNEVLPQTSPSIVGPKPAEEAKNGFLAAYLTPISFYGKVVDESGAPIDNAVVKLITADSPVSNGSEYERLSDERGLFSLLGGRGAGVVIYVSKAGYYSTKQSQGRFVYGGVRSNNDPVNPVITSPALFILKKAGVPVPLIKLKTGSVMLPKNGPPTKLSLRREKAKFLPLSDDGDITLELWSDYNGTEGPQKYNWRFRLSVPGGGSLIRENAYDFSAPKGEYNPIFEFEMQSTADRWRPSFGRDFFIKLKDGSYARLKMDVTTGNNHFVVLESYLNPTSGDRNLEFDPAKVIKPTP